MPSIRTIIGFSCSNDIADLYEWLDGPKDNVTLPAGGVAVMSPESRASEMTDNTKYPNLARFVPNEPAFQTGVVETFMRFGWTRIGILSDDSLWAQSTKETLLRQLAPRCPHCVITNSASRITMNFSRAAFRDKSITPRSLLEDLVKYDTRVLWIVTQDDIQRDIFASIWQTKLLYGAGHALYTCWMTERSFFHPQNRTMHHDAVRGAEGLLGYGTHTHARAHTHKTGVVMRGDWVFRLDFVMAPS